MPPAGKPACIHYGQDPGYGTGRLAPPRKSADKMASLLPTVNNCVMKGIATAGAAGKREAALTLSAPRPYGSHEDTPGTENRRKQDRYGYVANI
ncbi:hypothetical protein BXY39_1940 [Eilatimonas milleporae]|uniref:Uncharacterized protein n=1 Tax=Eilatimonas milleporae TaxID=911205 RepID=A0A3M0CG97_9PROT|nr:hypothetical protein BXY39_1940 [Eilatimonas milleporae]